MVQQATYGGTQAPMGAATQAQAFTQAVGEQPGDVMPPLSPQIPPQNTTAITAAMGENNPNKSVLPPLQQVTNSTMAVGENDPNSSVNQPGQLGANNFAFATKAIGENGQALPPSTGSVMPPTMPNQLMLTKAALVAESGSASPPVGNPNLISATQAIGEDDPNYNPGNMLLTPAAQPVGNNNSTAQVIPPVQLPPGVVPSPQSGTSQDVLNLAKQQAVNPKLAEGTAITPVAQNVNQNELLNTQGVSTTAPVATAPTATSVDATATTPAASQQVADPATQAAAQYTATTVGTAPTMTAAQGTVTQPITAEQGAITSDATVQGQLAGLQQQVTDAVDQGKNLPAWALGAQKLVEANMAKRGLGASSMYAEAMAQGIMQSATPIAAADAATYKDMIFQNLNNRQQSAVINAQAYLQMDMANLSNNQQANLQNLQSRQATLFSDQAANNAAAQFNATSTNQVDQFYKNLSSSVSTANAQRADAMNQFSTSESNKISAQNANNATAVSQANAQTEASINQFNSQLTDQRERFNVQNQQVIDQSNANWRRSINTANTASVNAANQTNAQNLLGISNFAMSSLWQQWRDEASWTNEAAQNSLNRAHNMATAALERQTAFDINDQASRDSLFELLGRFAAGIFK